MNPRIKARWLKALRSGRYKQATGALRNDDGYCCLGVLCDLARRSKIGKWDDDANFEGCSSDLPEVVAEWAGLDSSDPYVPTSGGRRVALSNLNDYGRLTFKQIADYIEKSL